jgi:hypothetical protein
VRLPDFAETLLLPHQGVGIHHGAHKTAGRGVDRIPATVGCFSALYADRATLETTATRHG